MTKTDTDTLTEFRQQVLELDLDGVPTFGISFGSKSKRDTRNKRYHRNVSLRIYQVGGPEFSTRDLPLTTEEVPVPHAQTVLEKVMPLAIVKTSYSREFSYCLERTFKAEKLSQIISPDDALEALADDARRAFDGVDDKVLVAELAEAAAADPLVVILASAATRLRRVFKAHSEIRERVGRQKAACRLAGWITRDAHEEAMKVTRFQQRFDALVAEFESEQKIQLAARLKKGGQLDTDTDGSNEKVADSSSSEEELWDKRSVEAARKFADRFKRGPVPRGFPRSDLVLAIKLHEVE